MRTLTPFNFETGTELEAWLADTAKAIGLESWGQLCRLLRVSRNAVRDWRISGVVPPKTALQIKGATGHSVPAHLIKKKEEAK